MNQECLGCIQHTYGNVYERYTNFYTCLSISSAEGGCRCIKRSDTTTSEGNISTWVKGNFFLVDIFRSFDRVRRLILEDEKKQQGSDEEQQRVRQDSLSKTIPCPI